MNRVVLLGNLVKDPEMLTTSSGHMFCRFTVACRRKYKNAEGKYDADFISCKAWRRNAEFICQNFCKGQKISVEGTIETGSYEDQQGQRRYTTEVVVDNAEFAGNRPEGGTPPGGTVGKGGKDYYPVSTKGDVFADDVDSTFEPLSDADLPF